MNDAFQHFARDCASLLKEQAFAAKQQAQAAHGSAEADCYTGRLMAFYEVISLLQQQASAFGIPLAELDLADIHPEHDLLTSTAAPDT